MFPGFSTPQADPKNPSPTGERHHLLACPTDLLRYTLTGVNGTAEPPARSANHP
ncbi:hypothetical protein HMPREF0388_0337 [Mobiluncus curtisii ATCC 51333]|uniref:Uncharacterized protein n=1 Tax=Mobiluncus curtisii ATCC 51333 TaxID=887326 RepID=E6LX64_9ACTO|nr:hypothetical protein HMPREF0388_0337 [Mobiluncus curtisii ATCC 51333]